MLTFLRRIRRSLISSSSMRNYFLYAIGEILLVMIGILLALQVNNWNNQRLERKSEGKALLQLKEEIENNNKQFLRIQRLHTEFFNAVDLIFDFMDHKDTSLYNVDTLAHSLGWLASAKTPTYNPSESLISSLINSGKMDIIKNDSLRNLLIEWKDLVTDFQEEELNLDAFKADHVVPFIAKNVDVFHRDTRMYGDPMTDIWDSSHFKSLLSVVSHYRFFILVDGGIGEGPKLSSSLKQIDQLVNSELRKRFKAQ